jgi:ribonuclease E
MTRKRVGSGLLEVFSETCEHCGGRGVILHDEPVEKRPEPSGRGQTGRPSPGGGSAAADEQQSEQTSSGSGGGGGGRNRRRRGGGNGSGQPALAEGA